MDPQTANFAFFNGAFQIRCARFSGVERKAVIFNIENQFVILMRNRNINDVFFIIFESVRNDVGKQLVKCQVGFKYAFWGQSDKLYSYVLNMNYALEAPNPPTNQKNKAKMTV